MAVWQTELDKTIKINNTWEAFNRYPKERWDALTVPRIEPVVPEPRNGMTLDKFLKSIGRECEQHVGKFKSWQHLFATKGKQMKGLGIGLADRKYILRWLEKYRQGLEPKFEPFKSRSHRHDNLEWRLRLITQKDLRKQYRLDE